MKGKKRINVGTRWVGLAIIIMILFLVNAGNVLAEPVISSPGLNPAFVKYQKALAIKRLQATSTTSEKNYGHIPSPVDYSYLKNLPSVSKRMTSATLALPAKYDLRTLGKVTPVKNQGSCGSCWTFGNMGSMESNLLVSSSTTWDFLE